MEDTLISSRPRICISCQEWKPHSRDFRHQMCGNCWQKKYRAENSERVRATAKARYLKRDTEKKAQEARNNYLRHREKRLAWQRAYHEEHKEERTVYNKEWAKQNRPRLRAYMTAYRHSDHPGAVHMREKSPQYLAKYRANNTAYAEAQRARQAIRRAKGGQAVLITISQAMFDHDCLCHLCGAPIVSVNEAELDHIVPLAAGGEHVRDNLAPAHARCNRIKRGLHPDMIPPHIAYKFIEERLRKGIAPPNWPMV